MKIEIYGTNGAMPIADSVFDSVHVDTDDLGCHVLINTKEKWVPFHYSGSSLHYVRHGAKDGRGVVPDHTSFSVGDINEDDEDEADRNIQDVVLIPETDDETKMLSGLKYSLQAKDQIQFLIVNLDLRPQISLASLDKNSGKTKRPGA